MGGGGTPRPLGTDADYANPSNQLTTGTAYIAKASHDEAHSAFDIGANDILISHSRVSLFLKLAKFHSLKFIPNFSCFYFK